MGEWLLRVDMNAMPAALTWEGPRLLPMVVCLAVAVVVSILVLYLPQVRRLNSRRGWALPALRAAALLALVGSIFKLSVTLPAGDGVVAILVDRSRSMGVCDGHRSPAQLVALADALGRLPAGVRTVIEDDVAADISRSRIRLEELALAQRDLDFARLPGHDREGALGRVKSATGKLMEATHALLSRRAMLKLKGSALAEPMRDLEKLIDRPVDERWAESMVKALDRIGSAAQDYQGASDRELYASSAAVRSACNALAGQTRFELARDALLGPASGLMARLKGDVVVKAFGFARDVAPLEVGSPGKPAAGLDASCDGIRTDVTGAVEGALEQLRGLPVQAVVLYSDGRQTEGAPAISAGLAGLGVPVFTVAMAPEEPPPDAAITRIHAPSSAFVGETISVHVAVRGMGGMKQPAAVALTAEDEHFERPAPPGGQGDVEFRVRLKSPGPLHVVASLPLYPREASVQNNRADAWIKVLEEPVKAALYAASPAWDFRDLRSALSEASWARLQSGLLGAGHPRFPLTPAEILQQDVVILYDVPAGALDASQREALHKLVYERGGGAILVGGPAHLPREYSDAPLADLLPFDSADASWRTWSGEDPAYRFAPAARADAIEALRLADDAGLSRQRWEQLPPVFSYVGASKLKPNAVPWIVELESGRGVWIERAVGAGRTLFVGTNETWRWRYQAGGRDQDRLWLQAVRAMSPRRYALSQGSLSADVEPVTAWPGAPFKVRAKWNWADGPEAPPPGMLKIAVTRADKTIREDDLPPAGLGASGSYEAALPGLPEGDYVLRITAPGAASAALNYPLSVYQDDRAELSDVSGDRSLLLRLAQSSGGQMLSLDEIGELPELIRAAALRRPQVRETRLWDSPYLFVFAAACLSAEWALRKRFGFA